MLWTLSFFSLSLSLLCPGNLLHQPEWGGVTIETVVVAAAAAAASVNAVVKEKMCCKRRTGDVCVPFSDGLMKRLHTTELGGFSVLLLYTGASFETRRSVSSLNTWSPKQHGTRQKKERWIDLAELEEGPRLFCHFSPFKSFFKWWNDADSASSSFSSADNTDGTTSMRGTSHSQIIQIIRIRRYRRRLALVERRPARQQQQQRRCPLESCRAVGVSFLSTATWASSHYFPGPFHHRRSFRLPLGWSSGFFLLRPFWMHNRWLLPSSSMCTTQKHHPPISLSILATLLCLMYSVIPRRYRGGVPRRQPGLFWILLFRREKKSRKQKMLFRQ